MGKSRTAKKKWTIIGPAKIKINHTRNKKKSNARKKLDHQKFWTTKKIRATKIFKYYTREKKQKSVFPKTSWTEEPRKK